MFQRLNFGVESFFNPLERFGSILLRPIQRPWRRLSGGYFAAGEAIDGDCRGTHIFVSAVAAPSEFGFCLRSQIIVALSAQRLWRSLQSRNIAGLSMHH